MDAKENTMKSSLALATIALSALALAAPPAAALEAPPLSYPPPEGSYLQSCSDVHISDGKFLEALCRDVSGRFHKNKVSISDCKQMLSYVQAHSFQRQYMNYMNDDGNLLCTHTLTKQPPF